MGFRNPVTTATDPVARDLATQALTNIIPGSRLAADAVDGKTITGATFRTAPGTGTDKRRVQIDATSGLVAYNSTGAAVTSIGTDGTLTATGSIATAPTGARSQLRNVGSGAASFGTLEFFLNTSGSEQAGHVGADGGPGSPVRRVMMASGRDSTADAAESYLELTVSPDDNGVKQTTMYTSSSLVSLGHDPTATVTANGKLIVNGTGDVYLTSERHLLQLGPDTLNAAQFIMDQNEALARTLTLNGYVLAAWGLTCTNFGVTGSATVSVQGTSAASVLRKDYVDKRFASGIVLITPSAANVPTSAVISFGKTFGAAPSISVTPVTTVPGTAVTGVAVSSVTTTGATIWLTRNSTTATSVQWIAVDSGF